MKKSIFLIVLALILSACTSETNNSEKVTDKVTQAETNATTDTAKVEKKTLTSGVDLHYVDNSVRPQDDFYRYVNGKWLKEYVMPADKSRYGSFIALRDKSEKNVKGIIDNLAQHTYEKDTDEQKISDLYKSYMNTDAIEKAGIHVLDKDLEKIADIKDNKELMEYMAYADMNTSAPLGLYVYIDLKNSNQYITYVSQSGLGLPDRDYYFNDDEKFKNIRSKYLTLIENMFTLANFENPKQSAQTIMDLETQIAQGHWTNVETRDSEKSYNLKSFDEYKALMPDVDLDAWLSETTLPKIDKIVVSEPDYLEKLDKLIVDTPLADWKTYFKWKLLDSAAGFLPKKFDDENFAFYGTVLRGTPEQRPRWKRAISTVNDSLGELVGKIYVKTYFPPNAKKRMDNMIENLRAAYADSIKDLDWMSEETKAKALEKLHKFDPKIGYPSKWKDYSSLHIDKDSLVANMIAVNDWRVHRNRSKLGQPIDRTEWSMNPQTVNAYYSQAKNEIVFPAAILQAPFFNLEADDAVNYGGIGAVIGHEMGHGFDDQGSKFDGDGNLNSWWTDEDRKKFNAKTTMLINQFNNFKVLDGSAHVNGELTQGENIGDLSGLTISYRAFKKAHPDNSKIGGLTAEQRFFYGWAQIWRSKTRDEALLQQVATDPHSPGEFRANGPLRNFPPFQKLFNVKEGDKMYLPADKQVKIW